METQITSNGGSDVPLFGVALVRYGHILSFVKCFVLQHNFATMFWKVLYLHVMAMAIIGHTFSVVWTNTNMLN